MAIYKVLGLMSGTSLDGLDLCLIEFQTNEDQVSFKVERALTKSYSPKWLDRLQFSELNADDLAQLNVDLGHYFGRTAKDFLEGESVNLIASHGHTMYHQPDKKYTVQLGHGGALAMESGCTVVNDFRSQDVMLGGQGAPLVPIGDRDLFSQYEACLNLGGFANVSMEKEGQRMAWDICPVNFIMNHFAQKEGEDFDKDGMMARNGEVNERLLESLNNLRFYAQTGAKSLGAEWVWKECMPLLESIESSNSDILATIVEHCSHQIVRNLNTKNVLITGGGAKNSFLIESIKTKFSGEVVIPDEQIVDFKEALIFGYLGLLRSLEQVNVLASSTGASRDSCSGAIYLP